MRPSNAPWVFAWICSLALLVTPKLLAQEAEPRSATDRLVTAATRGDWEELQAALESPADVNALSDGMTAWAAARRHGFTEITALLEEHGADPTLEVTPWQQRLETLLTAKFHEGTPACVVLVAREGSIVYEKAFGMARLNEPARAATHETRFRIGSVTKQFVAAAILKLQEDEKLSIADPLSKYIAGFPRGDDITLRHLLTHTSGLVNYTSKPGYMSRVTSETSADDVIESFREDPLEFEPGDRFAYCNSGYFLLGEIVAKVSGQTLNEFLQQTFFVPLKMTDTEIHRPEVVRDNDCVGYSAHSGAVSAASDWHMSHAGGAGALISTAQDLYRWNEAIFSGKCLGDESLVMALSPTSLNDGTKSPYGFGWGIGEQRGLTLYSHTGGLNGFLSYLARYPESKTTIVVLANVMPSEGFPTPAVVGSQLGEEILWPAMRARQVRKIDRSISGEILKQCVGRYDYGNGTVLDVTQEGNQLFAQLTGQPRYPIYPADAATYFWKVTDAEVEFIGSEDGKVGKVIHRQNGQAAEHPRLQDLVPVALSYQQLDRYVGRYDYGVAAMTILRKDDRLIAQLAGQDAYEISPVSETRFRWQMVEAEIEFKLEGDTVTGATHRQGGRTFDVAKMEPLIPIELSAEKLDEYVGQYNYGFLAGRLSVSREGTALYAKLRGQSKLLIVPVGPDRFQWRDVNASVRFERNEQGAVARAVHEQGGQSTIAPRVE